MTKKEYESKAFVDDAVKRFHERTGSYPTKVEAIRLVRDGRRKHFFPALPGWGESMMQKRTYTRFAALELIRQFEEQAETDPVRIIYELWNWFDDMVEESEHPKTWIFCAAMRDSIKDILDLLY